MVDEGVPTGAAAGAAPRSQRVEDRNIRNLYLDTGWQGVITAGITTFLPVYLVRLGASTFLVGLLTSLPALVTIGLSVPAAAHIEGRRDLVRFISLTRFFTRLCFLLIALVPFFLTGDLATLTPAVIVAIWGLSAVFSSATTPAWTAVVAETVPPRRRPLVNGGRWAMVSLVTAIAVAFFGWLLDALPFPANYQIVFFLSFLAGLVSIYFFALIEMPEAPPGQTVRTPANPLRHIAGLARASTNRPDFPRYLLSTFVYRLGLNLPVALFPVYWVQELHSPDTWIGFRTTAGHATLVLAYFLFGRLAGWRGHREVLLICSVGLSFYPVLTAFVRSPEWLVPVAVVWGLFAAGIDISFFEGLLEASPRGQRANFAAVNATFANLAVFLGPVAGTSLAGWVGIRPVFFVAGGLCLLGALLFYRLAVAGQRVSTAALPGDGE